MDTPDNSKATQAASTFTAAQDQVAAYQATTEAKRQADALASVEGRVAYLGSDESLTWGGVLSESPLVMHAFTQTYPTRAAALQQLHSAWVVNGRPADAVRTSPVTAPTPPPAPTTPDVKVPRPDEIVAMVDLVALGIGPLNAFRERYPAEYAALQAKQGATRR